MNALLLIVLLIISSCFAVGLGTIFLEAGYGLSTWQFWVLGMPTSLMIAWVFYNAFETLRLP